MAFSFDPGNRRSAEELDDSALNRECDPPVDDGAESLVIGQALFELLEGTSANEPADRLSPVHVGEFVVGTVSMRLLGVHAAASRVSADVILL